MRKGFTLLELLITVTVLGIASAALASAYNSSQIRVEFQIQSSDIQSAISVARSSALSDDSLENFERIVQIDMGDGEVVSFIDEDQDRQYTEGVDPVLREVILGDQIEFRDVYALLEFDGEINWFGGMNSGSFRVVFTPPEPTCTFIGPGASDSNPDEYMFELPLYRPGDDEPNRYVYFHKISCIPELLSKFAR